MFSICFFTISKKNSVIFDNLLQENKDKKAHAQRIWWKFIRCNAYSIFGIEIERLFCTNDGIIQIANQVCSEIATHFGVDVSTPY